MQVVFEQQPIQNNMGNTLSNDSISCPIEELTVKCDRLISEYQEQLKKNQEMRAEIENYEKEKLLLTRPQFFDTEMSKLELTIKVYQQTLEELERQSCKILELIKHNSDSFE